MQKIKDFETFVTESRKFGGCGLFSFQSPAQLENVYGVQSTRTIIGNCSTRVAFFDQDPEIAERVSRSFGKKEIEEKQTGLSYGAHEMRDGINISTHTKIKPVISASDIQTLQVNRAFLKLPGKYPATKIKVRY